MNVVSVLLARVAAAGRERARAEAALASAFAPGFNVVALLAPGETRMSAAFRWMLDETETHGQGRVFRDLFVADVLGDEPESWRGARVSCEVATADRRGRIDLLLESGDGARCVVVENKPWAGWQVHQLARYLNDQRSFRAEVRVHALIGDPDPARALERHWAEQAGEAPPPCVGASGFDAVVAWIESCAAAARPDKVRAFLFDLADYCRQTILCGPAMTETHDVADLIAAGGEDALRAAHLIAAAVPLAMTHDVARRIGGIVERTGAHPGVRMVVDDVRLHFVLFGVGAPWAGVTDARYADALCGALSWDTPERRWPKWIYLKKLGGEGRALIEAVKGGRPEMVADLLPALARTMLGR